MRLLDFQGFRPRPWTIWTYFAGRLLPRLLPREPIPRRFRGLVASVAAGPAAREEAHVAGS